MKLTIDRARWYRGHGGSTSCLQLKTPAHDGPRCCLGFLALALGHSERAIEGVPDPTELLGNLITDERMNRGEVTNPECKIEWPRELIEIVADEDADDPHLMRVKGRVLLSRLITVNDSEICSEAKRERDITVLMHAAGVEVEFVGDGRPASAQTPEFDIDGRLIT